MCDISVSNKEAAWSEVDHAGRSWAEDGCSMLLAAE